MKDSASQLKDKNIYQRWVKAMAAGERMGCHQKPERSFYVNGYQMPVCSRCIGVYIGYLLGILLYTKFGFSKLKEFGFVGLVVMFMDWWLQQMKVWESTNVRRLFTGIYGGIGFIIFYIKGIALVCRGIKKLFGF